MNTNDLRKAGVAVFLVTTEEVAMKLSNKLKEAADEIDRLREQVASQPTTSADGETLTESVTQPEIKFCPECGTPLGYR